MIDAAIVELSQLEEAVRKSEGEGLRARWESGRYMLTLKKGKQLPKGMLDTLATTLEVGRSELTARMKFASKFATEADLTDAIGKFRTWFNITREALTDTPRVDRQADTEHADTDPNGGDDYNEQLRQVIAFVEHIDPANVDTGTVELLAQLRAAVQRIQDGVQELQAA